MPRWSLDWSATCRSLRCTSRTISRRSDRFSRICRGCLRCENSADIRARIVARLAWLGAVLDAKANAAHALRISASDSGVALYVIPTDEELMIARHTLATLSADSFQ